MYLELIHDGIFIFKGLSALFILTFIYKYHGGITGVALEYNPTSILITYNTTNTIEIIYMKE